MVTFFTRHTSHFIIVHAVIQAGVGGCTDACVDVVVSGSTLNRPHGFCGNTLFLCILVRLQKQTSKIGQLDRHKPWQTTSSVVITDVNLEANDHAHVA